MGRRTLVHGAWLVAVLVSTGLSGCAATATPREPAYRVVNGETYVPVPPAEREYFDEAAKLKLPDSRQWPAQPFGMSEPGTPQWYQLGYGRQAADRFWFCSWASVAFLTSDPEVRRQAVDTAQGILRLYYYTDALAPPDRPQLVNEVTSAQHGDLTALSTDLHLNC